MSFRSASIQFLGCLLCLPILLLPSHQMLAADLAGPLSVEESLPHFQLPDGLLIECVASEPDVIDPVAVRFDEQGAMWVVEMRDYPHGPDAGEKPKSRIKRLTDLDGDGRFETVQVFADELLFCTGVQPWKGGLIVTMAGEVAYFRDTDGDGRADHRETWYTGFAQENSQLRANHPRLGLDHHVYIANGLRGGTVINPRDENAEKVSISGKDFRFDPVGFGYEAITGAGQFGLTFDDDGERFVCSNRNPLKHIVLEESLIRKNPGYAPPAATQDVAVPGEDSRIFPLSRAWTTSNLHAGQFTAACGVLIFRGDGLPDAYYGNGMTCDPTGNLVHREIVQIAGGTYQSRPAREGIEFLASPDEWFRPVNLTAGPDGGLYVVDMYRAVIEHPQFMPTELKERPDLYLGIDRGRIYRVRRTDTSRRPWESMADLGTADLVRRLSHRNAWQRDTAARLLFERQDRAAIPHLEELLVATGDAQPRVHALWSLHGLAALHDQHLLNALADDRPRVRAQAVKLAGMSEGPASRVLQESVRALAEDGDPRVRFQVAQTLALVTTDAEADALARLAAFGSLDVWTARAVAVAAGDRPETTLHHLLDKLQLPEEMNTARGTLMTDLINLAAKSNDEAAGQALAATLRLPAETAETKLQQQRNLIALVRGLSRRRITLPTLLSDAQPEMQRQISAVFDEAQAIALDATRSSQERRQAIEVLAVAGDRQSLLADLALEESDRAVRLQAISSLAAQPDLADGQPWINLLESFPSESPPIRNGIVSAVLARDTRVASLLDRIAAGSIRVSELDASQTNRLLKHRNAELRKRAEGLLAAAIPQDRRKVLTEYQIVLQMEGDPNTGQTVFQKNCATCHRIGELGVNVAPDISDSRTRQPSQLLTDILQPNRAIDANFVSYSVITVDGLTETGVIGSETSTSITLRQPEGKERTLLRSEVEVIQSNGVSLMPEGLEKNIPPQAMADLIAFIKHWRYLDGRTPLGE